MKRSACLLTLFCVFFSCELFSWTFIPDRQTLSMYSQRSDVVLVASTGRSGSTLLTNIVERFAKDYKITKTHLLPPTCDFKGKILFIFSNPDKAAESILHGTLANEHWDLHFWHMESSDSAWLKEIGKTTEQTVEHNLLAYDALGCYEHLKQWLHTRTLPTTRERAQVFAVKYEHLWEEPTLKALRDFLGLDELKLPPQRTRGYKRDQLTEKEALFRELYNLGSYQEPRYAAYDEARILWEEAPPFQYLDLS